MTMNVKGAPDMVDHNGAAGWGVSNRVIGPRALGLPAPVWLDGSFWFPLPISECNAQPQTLTVTRYRQGPSESTPLL